MCLILISLGRTSQFLIWQRCWALLLQVQWFPSGEQLVTSSADKSVRCWDVEAGMQVKRLTEHTSIVNSINPMQRGPALFVSGGDDSKVKVGAVLLIRHRSVSLRT